MTTDDVPFSRQTISAANDLLKKCLGTFRAAEFRYQSFSSWHARSIAIVQRAALEYMRSPPLRENMAERKTFSESLFRDGFSILQTGEIAPIPTMQPERYEANVQVFISYRRDDSKYQARDIYKAFCQVISPDHVFMDVDSIPPGANFRETLEGWVDQCDVLLALIGPGWVDARDPKTNRRRLDNPSDFVRVEIGEALARGIPVVPVLIDGAPMPDIRVLPEDLKELVDRQAVFVEYRTFYADVEQLIRKLGLS
jgi:hypothetical protein